MAETTRRHALPLLQPGQAQKEVTHNEAMAAADTLLHLAVASRTIAAPPLAPTAGRSWIVGPAPTGVWTGKASMIATFDDAGWRYLAPVEGCVAWVADEGCFAVRASGAWRSDSWPVRALLVRGRIMLNAEPVSVSAVSGGVVIDVEARAGVTLVINALRAMGIVAPE